MIIVATIRSDLVTIRTHNRIIRNVFRHSMEQHRNFRMKKHFKVNANTRPGGGYGYAKRTEEYERRKKTYKGHNKPHSFTRRQEGIVRQQSKVTATKSRAKMVARNYFRMPVQHRAELEAITDAEEKEIAQGNERMYLKEIAKPENRRKRAQKTKG